ncbi:hypothetical protein E2562_030727 [Oryza meyeriana var. granulata]|uniref:Uncharacterized protein n=1 Tax=Oryza meyeriana var. granulata TaxID=110450 RepID=A0A6G1E6P4_9ORYZ|nr:hypothetical protein E2562_030727 [Oryza meyeriana var. granulata]
MERDGGVMKNILLRGKQLTRLINELVRRRCRRMAARAARRVQQRSTLQCLPWLHLAEPDLHVRTPRGPTGLGDDGTDLDGDSYARNDEYAPHEEIGPS